MSYASIRTAVWVATLIVTCALALTRGGRSERVAAGALSAGWLLTVIAYRFRFGGTEWGILAIDVALLGVLAWIALRSDRYWPLTAAGFHLLAVITHVARIVDVHVNHWGYITAEIIWGYLLAIAIGYGAWTYRRGQLAANAGGAFANPSDTRR